MQEKIKDWLRSQGYPLELSVASALRRHGFSATLANFYKDPNEGQSRQIDVIATRHDHTGFFRAEIVIECKRSLKYPWLLLSADNSSDRFSLIFEYALTSDAARLALAEKTTTDSIDTLKKLPWMQWDKSRGVGLVPAFNDKGPDVAFKAVAGAMAAAIARRAEHAPTSSNSIPPLAPDPWQPLVFIFPIVIVDNDLFECKLDAVGDIEVSQIEEARLYFPMHFGKDNGTCVHIVTSKILQRFVEEARAACDELQRLFEPKSRILMESFLHDIKAKG